MFSIFFPRQFFGVGSIDDWRLTAEQEKRIQEFLKGKDEASYLKRKEDKSELFFVKQNNIFQVLLPSVWEDDASAGPPCPACPLDSACFDPSRSAWWPSRICQRQSRKRGGNETLSIVLVGDSR